MVCYISYTKCTYIYNKLYPFFIFLRVSLKYEVNHTAKKKKKLANAILR